VSIPGAIRRYIDAALARLRRELMEYVERRLREELH
jgi:hypothetical protein